MSEWKKRLTIFEKRKAVDANINCPTPNKVQRDRGGRQGELAFFVQLQIPWWCCHRISAPKKTGPESKQAVPFELTE